MGLECYDYYAKALKVSDTGSGADMPDESKSDRKLSLAAIIGVRVAGGKVALSCLVSCIVWATRNFKQNVFPAIHTLERRNE